MAPHTQKIVLVSLAGQAPGGRDHDSAGLAEGKRGEERRERRNEERREEERRGEERRGE